MLKNSQKGNKIAISLNLFNHHSTFNTLENLKPRISKEPNDSDNKTGDKNAKADTQDKNS